MSEGATSSFFFSVKINATTGSQISDVTVCMFRRIIVRIIQVMLTF